LRCTEKNGYGLMTLDSILKSQEPKNNIKCWLINYFPGNIKLIKNQNKFFL